MMKKCIKQEMLYGYISKLFIILSVLLGILFTVTLYTNYNAANRMYRKYLYYVEYYHQNNIDMEEALSSDYTVEKAKDGSMTIDNPLAYSKALTGKYIYATSPKYALSQMMESSLLFFPLIFGLLGMMMVHADYKYNIYKVKTVRINKVKLNIAKQLSVFISSIFVITGALIIGFIASFVLYSRLSGEIPFGEFEYSTYKNSTIFLCKLLYGLLVAIVFSEIGYTLGFLFKNVVAGFIAITIYTYILPIFGKYNLKNVWYFCGKKCFDYYGSVRIIEPSKINWGTCAIIITCIVSSCMLLNFFLAKKRSSYN